MKLVQLSNFMRVVVDTSALIAVLVNEPRRSVIVRATLEAMLIAPPSLHWEVGNACTAMFKKGLLSIEQARKALDHYGTIPVEYKDISLNQAVELAAELGLYAYDAYMLVCARQYNAPLLTLDKKLRDAALRKNIPCIEV